MPDTSRAARRVKFGVQLPEVERVVRWPEIRAMAVLAEDSGFDSVWVGDHFLYPDETGPYEAWTQLAAIAAVTSRIELGPLVAAVPFHQPPVLAKLAWTVDEIADGRLVLGVGAGWNETEFRALGLPFTSRVERFEEGFSIIRRLIAGEKVTSAGHHYDIEGCVLLPPTRRTTPMPLMIGSTGPRMLAITLPYVSAWNAWFSEFDNLPQNVPALLDRFGAACERAGRDPADIEKSVALLLDFGSSAPRNHSTNPVTGSVAQMAEAVARVVEAGIDHIQFVLDPITAESIVQAASVVDIVRRRGSV